MPTPATPSIPAQRIWALVPCAGSGKRAAAGLPKQYRSIAGKPLVLHTLAALGQVNRLARTLVVVAAHDDFLHARGAAVVCGDSCVCQRSAENCRHHTAD
jgi:2-C-methyl-D-erythritol 4-phosphate cytidylyltransferase